MNNFLTNDDNDILNIFSKIVCLSPRRQNRCWFHSKINFYRLIYNRKLKIPSFFVCKFYQITSGIGTTAGYDSMLNSTTTKKNWSNAKGIVYKHCIVYYIVRCLAKVYFHSLILIASSLLLFDLLQFLLLHRNKKKKVLIIYSKSFKHKYQIHARGTRQTIWTISTFHPNL